MREETVLKIVAIVCLASLWVVNALTFKLNGVLLTFITTAIAGIAGYELAHVLKKYPSKEELRALCKMLNEEEK